MRSKRAATPIIALLLLLAPLAVCTTTWYVNGKSGSDSNACTSSITACKTISRAISLAASGDTINVSRATYVESLNIGLSIKILGASANTTIVDAGKVGGVVYISSGSIVTLSGMTFRNGFDSFDYGPGGGGGAGIRNAGTLTLNNAVVSRNVMAGSCQRCIVQGGGIHNSGKLVINNSTISGNKLSTVCEIGGTCIFEGSGIANVAPGVMTIQNSTISGNIASSIGAIVNAGGGRVSIINSTISGNKSSVAIVGPASIFNSTISGNYGLGIGGVKLQNSIVANNSSANCVSVTSMGYNLSSDGSCAFNGPGDLNNTDPMLGPLQNNGGPTKTMALPSGSPALDAGNPSGCTDNHSHLLKTDQRGMPRPGLGDTGVCDIGAYERQN